MDSFRNGLRIACLVIVCMVLYASHAGEHCDVLYVNQTEEEVLAIRCRYATPYDEPRHDKSGKNLPPGGEFRLGIQGVTLPELILIDFATKSFVFEDLSGLNPESDMRLEIAHEDGRPLLRRLGAEGGAVGEEREYLSAANRPNAVDKDSLANVADIDELVALLRVRITEEQRRLGDVERFDVEAGPIWSQEHAMERCPEVAREWGGMHDSEARWTGHWLTTVPGEMSVCNCMTGTADEDWGKTIYFPVSWRGRYGAGLAAEPRRQSEDDLPIGLRFKLPAGGELELLDELLSELRLDGLRPAKLVVEMWMEGREDEEEKGDIDFRQEDDSPWSVYAMVMEVLDEAYEFDRLDVKLFLVEQNAFKLAEDGDTKEPIRGAFCVFSKGIFETILMPDVRDIWDALQDAADDK